MSIIVWALFFEPLFGTSWVRSCSLGRVAVWVSASSAGFKGRGCLTGIMMRQSGVYCQT